MNDLDTGPPDIPRRAIVSTIREIVDEHNLSLVLKELASPGTGAEGV
jgi:hypothetical protein